MFAALPASHWRGALALLQRRDALRQTPLCPANLLRSVEIRLAAHLQALAHCDQSAPDELPDKPCDALLTLAVLLLRAPEQGAEQLADWLGGKDLDPDPDPDQHNHDTAPLADALRLCASPESWRVWMTMGTRPALLDQLLVQAASGRGAKPDATWCQTLLELDTPALVHALLRQPALLSPALLSDGTQGAAHDHAALDYIRQHYTHPDTVIAAAACQAGLRLEDGQARALLRTQLAQPRDDISEDWLWLNSMALPTQPCDALWTRATAGDGQALLWLALTGLREAAPVLLEALAAPRHAETAAIAWQWLSGQALPRRPRLQQVGDEQASRDTLPDIEQAQHYWQQHQQQWPADQRRALGIPLTDASTPALARQWAGQAGDMMLARWQLAQAGVPDSADWHRRRDEVPTHA